MTVTGMTEKMPLDVSVSDWARMDAGIRGWFAHYAKDNLEEGQGFVCGYEWETVDGRCFRVLTAMRPTGEPVQFAVFHPRKGFIYHLWTWLLSFPRNVQRLATESTWR